MQELDVGIMGFKPPPENSGFIPVFRSGSCSEKGPKQYMEDEFICVDDLRQHLGAAANLSSQGAFYGVCKLLLVLG